MTQTLIARYAVQLEAALGTDEFPAVFRAMNDDRRVTAAIAAEIATSFAFQTARSTPRRESMTRIRQRHENWMDSIAKEAAIGGKSAA